MPCQQVLHELYDEVSLLVEHGFQLVGSAKEGNPMTQKVAYWLLNECTEKLTETYLIGKHGEEGSQGSQSQKFDEEGGSSSSSSSSSAAKQSGLKRTLLGGPLVTKLWFDLDAQHGDYALNLALLQQSSDTRQRASIVLAPSLVELMNRLLEFRGKGIDDIDMLLGCPLLMFDQQSIPSGIAEQRASVRNFACAVTLHGINWFRQIMNTFIGYADAETRFKVLDRAHQLLELEAMMRDLFALAPNFRPPASDYLYYGNASGVRAQAGKRRKTAFGKPAGAGKKQKTDTSFVKVTAKKKRLAAKQKASKRKIKGKKKKRNQNKDQPPNFLTLEVCTLYGDKSDGKAALAEINTECSSFFRLKSFAYLYNRKALFAISKGRHNIFVSK